MGVKGGGKIDIAAAGAVNPVDYIHVESARPKSSSKFDYSENRIRKRPDNVGHNSTPSTLPRLATGIPTDLHLALLLNKTVLSSAAILVRQWLLTGHSEALHKAHQHASFNSHIFHHPPGFVNDQSNPEKQIGQSTLSASIQSSRIASPWAIATIIFIFAALGQTVWLQVWTWLPSLRRSDPHMSVMPRKIMMLGTIMFSSTLIWLMALERLGAVTVIIFTQFCEIWMADLVRSFKLRSHGSYLIVAALVMSFILQLLFPPSPVADIAEASFPYDDPDNPLPPSLRHTRPMHLASPTKLRENSLRAELEARSYSPSGLLFGHLLLLAYAILTMERERFTRYASQETGGRRRAQVLACIAIAFPVFTLSTFGHLIGFSSLPSVSSLIPSFDASSSDQASSSGHSAAYIMLAIGLLILEPLVGAALEPHASTTARVTQGWPLAVGASLLVGRLGFSLGWKWTELLVCLLVAIGLRSILKTSPLHANDEHQEKEDTTKDRSISANFDGTSRTHKRKSSEPSLDDALKNLKTFVQAAKDTVESIWANENSRKIFQFLVLNLAFMVVQLIWGVWTNSLGLISDAIHMFFDCLAIGMGLLASVMQNWKNDRTFTYGYGRVETLSGFANGVFLLLISIFIVFEGIDRIIHPPEMHNTRQLLIVSSMGLGVNLFGMFAMGGHHHHHHGHSHGHDHGHDHGHHHSHNMLGIYLHVMADTLGSVGVIISTLLIQYFGWTGFDPIASLIIAILIVGSVIPLVIDAGRILCLDLGTDREREVEEALQELHSIEGLASFSSAHFWPKDSESIIGTIRIQFQMIPISVDSTPGSTISATSNGTNSSMNNISKDTSLTSLSSHSGENSPTSSGPISDQTVNQSQIMTPSNSSTTLNGVTESPLAQTSVPTVPAISPEKLMCQVEATLKRRIHGLDFILIQCERSNVIVNSATANVTQASHNHDHEHKHDHSAHNHHHAHKH